MMLPGDEEMGESMQAAEGAELEEPGHREVCTTDSVALELQSNLAEMPSACLLTMRALNPACVMMSLVRLRLTVLAINSF